MVDRSKLAGSKEVVAPEAQLFVVPETEASILSTREITFDPDSDNVNPVSFSIPATNAFIDLMFSHVQIYMNGSFTF